MSSSFLGNKKITNIIAPNGNDVLKIYFGDSAAPIYRKSFTITWNYLNTNNQWTSTTTQVLRGECAIPPEVPTPIIITSDLERKAFNSWTEYSATAPIWSNMTFTAAYKTQYYVEIDTTVHATASISDGWYDEGATFIWTADTHYEIDGQPQVTVTVSHGGLYTTHPAVKTYTVTGDWPDNYLASLRIKYISYNGTNWGTRVSKTYSDSIDLWVSIKPAMVNDTSLGNGQFKKILINDEWSGTIYNSGSSGSAYGTVILNDDETLWTYDEELNTATFYATTNYKIEIDSVIYYKKLTSVAWDEHPGNGIASFSIISSSTTYTSPVQLYGNSDSFTYNNLVWGGLSVSHQQVYGKIILEDGYLPAAGWYGPFTKDGITYYLTNNLIVPENTCGYLNGGFVKLPPITGAIPDPSLTPYTITFDGDAPWQENTKIAFYGDILVQKPAWGAPTDLVIACYKNGSGGIRWINKASSENPIGPNNEYWLCATTTDIPSGSGTHTVTHDLTIISTITTNSSLPTTSTFTSKVETESNVGGIYDIGLATQSGYTHINTKTLSNISYGATIYCAFATNVREKGWYSTYNPATSQTINTYPYGGFYIPEDNINGGISAALKSGKNIYGSVILTTDYFDFNYDSTNDMVVATFKTNALATIYNDLYETDIQKAISFIGNTNTYIISGETGIKSAFWTTNTSSTTVDSGITSVDLEVGQNNAVFGYVILETGYIPPTDSSDWVWNNTGKDADGNEIYYLGSFKENHVSLAGYPYRYYPGGKTYTLQFEAEQGWLINFEDDDQQLGTWNDYSPAYAPETVNISHNSSLTTSAQIYGYAPITGSAYSTRNYFNRTYQLLDGQNSYELSTYKAINDQLSGINYGDSWTMYHGGTIKPIVNSYQKTCAAKISAWYDHYTTVTSSTTKRIYYIKVEAVSGYSFLPLFYNYDYAYLSPSSGSYTEGGSTLTITAPGTYTITTNELKTIVTDIHGYIYLNANHYYSGRGPKFTIRNASDEIGTGDGSSASSPHVATIYASDAEHWYTKTPVNLRTISFASNEHGTWNDSNNCLVADGATITASGNTITISSTGGGTTTRTFTPTPDSVLSSHYYTVSSFTGTGTVAADTTITPQITSTKKDYAVKLSGKWLYYNGSNNWGIKPEAVSGYTFLATRGDYYVTDYYNGTWTDRTGTVDLPSAVGYYVSFSAGYWTGIVSAGVHFKLYSNGISAPDGGGFNIPAQDNTNDTTIILYAVGQGTWLHT